MAILRGLFFYLFLLFIPVKSFGVFAVDVSTNKIQISPRFNGLDVVLFGSKSQGSEIVAVVTGLRQSISVHKNGRKNGIWQKVDSRNIDNTYGYHKVYTSADLDKDVLKEYEIDLQNAQAFSFLQEGYKDAIFTHKEKKKYFSKNINSIENVAQSLLFKASIFFENNIPEGFYNLKVFEITADKKISNIFITEIEVSKTGISVLIENISHQHPMLYAICSVAMSILIAFTSFYVVRFFKVS